MAKKINFFNIFHSEGTVLHCGKVGLSARLNSLALFCGSLTSSMMRMWAWSELSTMIFSW